MSSPERRWAGLHGTRLALVESMLHDAFYDGVHQARALGCEVWLLIRDEEWYTGGHPWRDHPLAAVDRVLRVDTHDAAAVLDAVTDRGGRPLVDGLCSFSDYHTEVTAQVAEKLGLPSQGADAVALANHKHRLREHCADDPATVRHVLVTDARQLPDAARTLGFPLIAKPPSEAISHGVRRVDDPAQLRAAHRALSGMRASLRGQPRPGHVLLERHVEGTEVSVESLTVDGETHVHGVTSKELLPPPSCLERSHSFPVPLDPSLLRQVEETVVRVLRRIGYRQGPAHTELRLTPGGPKLIEVNPRLPAHMISTMVAEVCGANPHLDAKLLAVGGRPRPLPLPHTGGAAVVVLYPETAGRLHAVEGVDRAEAVPGVRVRLHAAPGDRLWQREDNSASVGFAYARGADAATALAAARRAARRLSIRVTPE